MELTSPNHDPYSSWQKTKEKMAEDGYTMKLNIIDVDQAKSQDGRLYKPENLRIQDSFRFLEKDSYLSPANKKMVPKYLLALQGSDDRRYYLEYYFKDPYQDTVLEFLNAVESVQPNRQFLN